MIKKILIPNHNLNKLEKVVSKMKGQKKIGNTLLKNKINELK